MTERLEGYLEDLRARLRGLPDPEVVEIVEELRSHVRESTPSGGREDGEVAAVLERFGSAAELASLYVEDRLLARAGRSRSPWVLLSSLFRWATLSVAGFFAFLGLLTGYVLSLSFLIAALHKPIAPDRVGLWRVEDSISLRLGFGFGNPAPGDELLGFWIVPIGLLAGAMGLWLTTWFARRCIRSLRRPPIPARP
jgi:DNA-binding transcriptional ArsR family regulator